MSDKSGQVRQSHGLRIVANWIFIKNVFSTLKSCSSDVVRDQRNFCRRCVGVYDTRINIYRKRVLIIPCGASLACVVCRNTY